MLSAGGGAHGGRRGAGALERRRVGGVGRQASLRRVLVRPPVGLEPLSLEHRPQLSDPLFELLSLRLDSDELLFVILYTHETRTHAKKSIREKKAIIRLVAAVVVVPFSLRCTFVILPLFCPFQRSLETKLKNYFLFLFQNTFFLKFVAMSFALAVEAEIVEHIGYNLVSFCPTKDVVSVSYQTKTEQGQKLEENEGKSCAVALIRCFPFETVYQINFSSPPITISWRQDGFFFFFPLPFLFILSLI